jgi:hypothetical protein
LKSHNRALDSSARFAPIAVVVTALAVLALGRFATASSSIGQGGAMPAASASPSPAVAAFAGSSSPPVASRPKGPTATAVACDPTRPTPRFLAPPPAPAEPPAYYHSTWYGSTHLWTMLDTNGETWRDLPQSAAGLTQKTFWWSADWAPTGQPEPAITITGHRLDAPGSFSFGPGTIASADFGTAMLVGIDVPTTGCWEITGRYRTATLSFTVSVEDHQPS